MNRPVRQFLIGCWIALAIVGTIQLVNMISAHAGTSHHHGHVHVQICPPYCGDHGGH